MIKILTSLLSFLLFLPFGMTVEQLPSYLCRLSITSPNGKSSLCNAVHIGNGRLLTAAHCFPHGQKNLDEGIIIAKCGNEEFSDFTKIFKSQNLAEDITLLVFSPKLRNSDEILPTAYPALYFSGSKLNPGVSCEILAIRGELTNRKLKRIKLDQSLDLQALSRTLLVVKGKDQSFLPTGTNVVEGDSGGALVCKTNQGVKSELIGIIKSYGSQVRTRLLVQNSFTPVFSPEAIKILKK